MQVGLSIRGYFIWKLIYVNQISYDNNPSLYHSNLLILIYSCPLKVKFGVQKFIKMRPFQAYVIRVRDNHICKYRGVQSSLGLISTFPPPHQMDARKDNSKEKEAMWRLLEWKEWSIGQPWDWLQHILCFITKTSGTVLSLGTRPGCLSHLLFSVAMVQGGRDSLGGSSMNVPSASV